jgi:hypothetical protein
MVQQPGTCNSDGVTNSLRMVTEVMLKELLALPARGITASSHEHYNIQLATIFAPCLDSDSSPRVEPCIVVGNRAQS